MHYPFLSSDRIRPRHLIVGEVGEDIATTYIRSLGYTIRRRNVRQGRDEIDIIAWDPNDQVLVFVEVKTRTEKLREGFNPEMTAAAEKRRKLRRAVRRWVAAHEYDGGYRIDLVCVREEKVTNHFKELAWD